MKEIKRKLLSPEESEIVFQTINNAPEEDLRLEETLGDLETIEGFDIQGEAGFVSTNKGRSIKMTSTLGSGPVNAVEATAGISDIRTMFTDEEKRIEVEHLVEPMDRDAMRDAMERAREETIDDVVDYLTAGGSGDA